MAHPHPRGPGTPCRASSDRTPCPPRARDRARGGFTLIELLVGLAIVAVLAGLVYPVVVQQIDRHHALRLAHDLVRLGTGIELLSTNLYPAVPSDIEDLFFKPDGSDLHLDTSTPYTPRQIARWVGPYVDVLSLPEGGDVWDQVIASGFESRIQTGLYCFDAAMNQTVTCVRNAGQYVAVEVRNVSVNEFEQVNDILDGEGEDDTTAGEAAPSWLKGRLRLLDTDPISPDDQVNWMYYLVAPYAD